MKHSFKERFLRLSLLVAVACGLILMSHASFAADLSEGVDSALHAKVPEEYLPELEGTVVFLAAPASDFVIGQTIYVDGGWTV